MYKPLYTDINFEKISLVTKYNNIIEACVTMASPHLQDYKDKTYNVHLTLSLIFYTSNLVITEKNNITNETKNLTILKLDKLRHMHDNMFITDNYIIISLLSIYFDLTLMNAIQTSFGKAAFNFIKYDDEDIKYIIISRKTGKIIKSYKTNHDDYYSHIVNGFEKDGLIYLYKCTINQKFPYNEYYMDYMKSDEYFLTSTYLSCTTIDIKNNKITFQKINNEIVDYPRIDQTLCGKYFTYTYCLGSVSRKYRDAIMKINVHTGQVEKVFYKKNIIPYEVNIVTANNSNNKYVMFYAYDMDEHNGYFYITDIDLKDKIKLKDIFIL